MQRQQAGGDGKGACAPRYQARYYRLTTSVDITKQTPPDLKKAKPFGEAPFHVPPSFQYGGSYGDLGVEHSHSGFWRLKVPSTHVQRKY